MSQHPKNSRSSEPRLWLIDRQEHLGRLAMTLFERAGFAVEVFQDYGDLADLTTTAATPELVILSCAEVDEDERQLLRWLVARGLPVLFVVGSVSVREIRNLFRAGARDGERMPDDPAQLLASVEQNLAKIRKDRQRPRVWMKAAM